MVFSLFSGVKQEVFDKGYATTDLSFKNMGKYYIVTDIAEKHSSV